MSPRTPAMVTFSHMPYAEALERGEQQDRALDRILELPDIERRYAAPEMAATLTSIVEQMVPMPG